MMGHRGRDGQAPDVECPWGSLVSRFPHFMPVWNDVRGDVQKKNTKPRMGRREQWEEKRRSEDDERDIEGDALWKENVLEARSGGRTQQDPTAARSGKSHKREREEMDEEASHVPGGGWLTQTSDEVTVGP
ncbi:hypothetical protein NDU88_002539 [Pleurodeles waltl]|uniref:Uncharacterized protein n=1 Tax=Pleurodeles waltl TaxID=8319 RepID=A0AAV7P9C4_PLEWA|nr:hypothetical protein NDU88_002539 [Pleurodeles waltl]